MLADATSSDDSPTPGYMLADISSECSFISFLAHLFHDLIIPLYLMLLQFTQLIQMILSNANMFLITRYSHYSVVLIPKELTLSNYNACTQLQEYLIARLAKKNHNIKYKCLVVIKVMYTFLLLHFF